MKLFFATIAFALFSLLVQANPTNRVGRKAVDITSSPYIAQIRLSDGSLICGGAILNFLYILTTASCVTAYNPEDLTIVVGTSNLENGTSYLLKKIIIHEEYTDDNETRFNDIAMLKLASYLRYNTAVRPILIREIWESEDIEEGSRAVLSGWGVSSTLRRIAQVINSVTQCIESYDNLRIAISDDYICATTEIAEENDHINNGTPLVQNSRLIGLKSWSAIGHPDVYTRIYLYLEWIEENNLE